MPAVSTSDEQGPVFQSGGILLSNKRTRTACHWQNQLVANPPK
ncbi:hypothetical protein RISK_002147 [Rhodopirellula islandica]|uniref:Uncharacterized protein n=1 Tax=Rhodopirellula islandica TaxID=595434 RepID=A0A0J1BG52_RHOIS|nr:hypothetical protein RISK_002147 [Rhodopirellula islandica]